MNLKRGMVSLGILLSFILAGCSNQKVETTNNKEETLKIYTSFYTMYDFTTKIVGDKAEVVNLVPVGTEPHDWEPATTDMAELEQADLFIYNGAGMEHWVSDVTEALTNPSLTIVEASKGIDLHAGHEDEEHEHEEAGDEDTDPHVWLSIPNAIEELRTIASAIIEKDPENQEYYEENLEKWTNEFETLDTKYREQLSGITNRNIIVSHEAYGYLCDEYGLNQVAISGLSADSEPDAKRMAEIISYAEENQISVIYFETLVSSKVADTIADELNAKTAVLNPMEGLTDEQMEAGEDYLSVMEENLTTLVGEQSE